MTKKLKLDEKNKGATRVAYGTRLAELGKKYKDIIVCDADLSGSTNTYLFAEKYPKRFFNFGIAEQNMVSASAGLASCGKTVFASTFAVFGSGRAYDQVRTSVCYGQRNVKICLSHAGIATGEDGPSHHATEDIGMMRVLPNMTVLSPADYYDTYKAVDEVYKKKGPVYLRLGRSSVPSFFNKNHKFKIGKADYVKKGKDATIIATGSPFIHSVNAVNDLEDKGFSVGLINMSSIKPLDEKTVLSAVKKTPLLITVEDHQIATGLGSAVSEFLTQSFTLRENLMLYRHGLKDFFAEPGSYEALYAKYKLDGKGIADEALRAIKLKEKSEDK